MTKHKYLFFFLCEENGTRIEKTKEITLDVRYVNSGLVKSMVEFILVEEYKHVNPQITEFVEIFESPEDVVDKVFTEKPKFDLSVFIEGEEYKVPCTEWKFAFDNSTIEEVWSEVIGDDNDKSKDFKFPEPPEISVQIFGTKNDFLKLFIDRQIFIDETLKNGQNKDTKSQD